MMGLEKNRKKKMIDTFIEMEITIKGDQGMKIHSMIIEIKDLIEIETINNYKWLQISY